ncbi:MAG: hypothetical protein R3194_08400 [Limnobacter sp.]|nr:hypothetical protein [Limnobacter sp.]
MNTFIDSIIRTPGVLFMSVLMLGFLLNAGVNYIDNTGLEGPNLLAAAMLAVGQLALVVIHQLRKVGEKQGSRKSLCTH